MLSLGLINALVSNSDNFIRLKINPFQVVTGGIDNNLKNTLDNDLDYFVSIIELIPSVWIDAIHDLVKCGGLKPREIAKKDVISVGKVNAMLKGKSNLKPRLPVRRYLLSLHMSVFSEVYRLTKDENKNHTIYMLQNNSLIQFKKKFFSPNWHD